MTVKLFVKDVPMKQRILLIVLSTLLIGMEKPESFRLIEGDNIKKILPTSDGGALLIGNKVPTLVFARVYIYIYIYIYVYI